jgi:hypothetical protein
VRSFAIAGIAGLIFAVLVISIPFRLDHAMRLHLWNLINRALDSFLTGQGTTGVGFISPYSVGAIAGVVTASVLLFLHGKRAVLERVVVTRRPLYNPGGSSPSKSGS